MKGYETKKKGIGLKPFKEKEMGKEAVSKKEKILVKLMNKHECSREKQNRSTSNVSNVTTT